MKVKKLKKRRITMGELWQYASFKKKRFLITDIVLILFAVGTLVYYTLEQDEDTKKYDVPKEVVVLKDNYKYNNGTLVFLNEDDELGTYNCTNQNPDLCFVASELNDDNFDTIKKLNKDNTPLIKKTELYINQYAFVFDNATNDSKSIKLVNFKDGTIIAEYLGIKSIRNTNLNIKENNYVIVVNTENKYGVIDMAGNVNVPIIPFEYDYLGVISDALEETDNKIVYRLGSLYGLVDFNNKKLNATYSEIRDYNHQFVKTIDSNLYSLYDLEGQSVISSYTYIDLLQDYIVAISNNKFLTVYNSALNRIINDELVVKNTNFVPTKIYENNVLVQEKKSFELSVIGDVLYVNIYDDENVYENTFSVLESTISVNYDFYSYENSYIYFYSDLGKLTNIGKYKCTNKNILTESSNAFNNCYLSKDASNNEAKITNPIYHNRYVFVYDSPTLVTDDTLKITLYDLTLNKKIGEYKNVYTYSKESDTKGGVYHVGEDDYYAVAINRNNKHGVLKLAMNEVKKSVDFAYDDIKLQDKYLVGKTGDEWSLIDYEGKSIVDGKYLLFELYNDMIVTIDKDNKLLIHDYENNVLINEPITLTSPTSEVSIAILSNKLMITVEGNTYSYDVETGDKIE